MNNNYVLSGLRPLEIEMIRAEMRGQTMPKRLRNGEIGQADASHSVFTIRTGNQWLNDPQPRPKPQMLFGELWYHNEICLMFADTNVGKSVLAVQIGNSIASGEAIAGLGLGVPPSAVLYVDFELSAGQFEARYTHQGQRFRFADGFYRAELSGDFGTPDCPEMDQQLVNKALEYGIKRTEASVLIIDNLSCLRSGTEKAGEALPLMKHLKALKNKYNLSILVLAHTPKRNPNQPLGRNDLQGSKMLINFCDSAFAIGESNTQPGMRYIKQIKQRYGSQTYGPDHVYLCRMVKNDSFLHYEFTGTGTEADHLLDRREMRRRHLTQQVETMHLEGHTQRHISRQLHISLGSVNGLVKLLSG